MEKSYFLSTTFNNIVFKGRNKAYGAYTLRRAYSKHMLLAATLATAIFSGALVGPLVDAIFFSDSVKYVKPTYTIVKPYTIKLPPPPTPEPAKAATPLPALASKKKVATEKHTPPKVVNEETPTPETIPNQEDLAMKNTGTSSIEGELPEIPTITLSEEPPTGIENGSGNKMPAPPAAFIHVDQMPMFKGGMNALAAYLGRTLRYPSDAQKQGVEGTVVVTFVVDAKGEISDVKVIKGLGYGTEEEARPVIQEMPKWEPGRQNGRPVPVRYTLPIRFSIQ